MIIKHILLFAFATTFITNINAKALIDSDVEAFFKKPLLKAANNPQDILTIIFLRSLNEQGALINDLKKLDGVKIQGMQHLPALLVLIPNNINRLNAIANHPSVAQISSYQPGYEELENSEQSILLRPSATYPNTTNWWDNNYTGKNGVLGLIDSGIDIDHPSLSHKKIIVRKEDGSGYGAIKNGVRTPHGTGVACIYMGEGSEIFPHDNGVAFDATTIITGLAGDGNGDFEDIGQTLGTLDWMLERSNITPSVINYSFGNGPVTCDTCTDWSGLAHVVDYIVNHDKILWVKSAGNGGYVEPTTSSPFSSTMTSPADNYNGLTVANMNPARLKNGKWELFPERNQHSIRYTSSRGPTLYGRRKPDITAPGNDTRTCAPDPYIYPFIYPDAMDYHDGYRLMGGTSSATPHVGAAILLLQEAGILEPIAQKGLLINSADAWNDSGKRSPDDPQRTSDGGHYPVDGSQWSRTYGWGYLNLQKAYEQHNNIVIDKLSNNEPQKSYTVHLPIGGKITLVHERRVGYTEYNIPWELSHLSLEIIDSKTNEQIAIDHSLQDTVHQVANCVRKEGSPNCTKDSKPIDAIVRVKLINNIIDGKQEEPFALVMSAPFKSIQ